MAFSTLRHPTFMPYSEGEKIDHRKRKRNRMRASCLNCYASKRKCDKKRPCTRCVRLGNTTLCVYETDESSQTYYDQGHNLDEIMQLRGRIAELEGVIHKIKNRSHPGWVTNDEADSAESVHFTPVDQKTSNTLGSLNVSTKSESLDYPLTPAFLGHRPTYNSGHYEQPEKIEVVDHVAAVYSPSLCSSCGDKSPHHTFVNDRKSGPLLINYGSLPWRDLGDDMSLDQGTFSRDSYSSGSSPTTYSLPNLHNSSTVMPSPPPSQVIENVCQCLKDPLAFAPLVNLGVALRTSREALESLHSSESRCGLFSYISFLENHIFSVSPQDFSPVSRPYPDLPSAELSNISNVNG